MKITATQNFSQVEILPRITVIFGSEWLIAFEFLFWGIIVVSNRVKI